MEMGKQILHMQIPYDVYAAAKALANERGVTMTRIVTEALREKIKDSEERKNE